MKAAQVWQLGLGNIQIMPAPRHRPPLKRPMWIIVLVSLASLLLIGAYVYPPQSHAGCYIFSSSGCKSISEWLPPVPARELTDEEIAAQVVIRDILKIRPSQSKSPKIAFTFLSPGSLPFEKLWDKFFRGHEDRFSIFVHASREKPVHVSRHFVGQEIRSEKVIWGKISMVDAERRLWQMHFKTRITSILYYFLIVVYHCIASIMCITILWTQMSALLTGRLSVLFERILVVCFLAYIAFWMIAESPNFIFLLINALLFFSFKDPGLHGSGRYSEHMLPEVEKKDFSCAQV
ncbi:hypothetical protein HHK36_021156 [Tetracentron sinense]|uniref:Uncharacterized protein n=1 Tax=Tetracentron sinense TaxID=13715 RepID=A0A834YWE7_TETSI|nr:hypothetical protein HHK36_021156 [Tetracentron sinense]